MDTLSRRPLAITLLRFIGVVVFFVVSAVIGMVILAHNHSTLWRIIGAWFVLTGAAIFFVATAKLVDQFDVDSVLASTHNEALVNMQDFHQGDRVRTAAVLDPRDYTEEAKTKRRPGVRGVVIAHHDSHGLCYDVRHEDGTIGTYDPDELTWIGVVA